jgi:hypothetical protein
MKPSSCVLCASLLLLGPCPAQQGSTPRCHNSTVAEFAPGLAPRAEAFLATLVKSVKAGDKARIAGMVQYPLSVYTGRGHRLIRNGSEFVAAYGQLFTLGVQKAVLEQVPECLFANYQGVMIGHGEVWFEEQRDGSMKIKTINVP